MTGLWRVGEYHGEFVDFREMMTWPKPVQKPHPPIIVGGAFPHAARRAIRYGDAWVPIARRTPYGGVNKYLPEFRQMVDVSTVSTSISIR
jgi:alkanesulfonate monooxygenase SsuD/methylene tetrahydromethanopterin reductase-like flavin-dependent oxidoreductase (luciferase family)